MVIDFPDFVTGFLTGAFDSLAEDDPDPAKKRHMVRLSPAFDAQRPTAPHVADYNGIPKELDQH